MTKKMVFRVVFGGGVSGIQAVAIRPLEALGRNPLGDREHVAIAWTS